MDPFILQCITNCKIVFADIPNPPNSMRCLHPEQQFSLQEQHAIDGEIRKFLDRKFIQLSETDTGQIIFPYLPETENRIRHF